MSGSTPRAYDEIPVPPLQAREVSQALFALRRLDEGSVAPRVRRALTRKLERALADANYPAPAHTEEKGEGR